MSFNFKGTHTFYNDKFLGSSLQKLLHTHIDIKAYIKIAGAVEPLEANEPQIKNIYSMPGILNYCALHLPEHLS